MANALTTRDIGFALNGTRHDRQNRRASIRRCSLTHDTMLGKLAQCLARVGAEASVLQLLVERVAKPVGIEVFQERDVNMEFRGPLP